MPVRAEVVLDDEERETLERWARRPKSSQALAFRCRIVLAAAEGRSSAEIASELGCNPSRVGRWRGRFAKRGFDGLHDDSRVAPKGVTFGRCVFGLSRGFLALGGCLRAVGSVVVLTFCDA